MIAHSSCQSGCSLTKPIPLVSLNDFGGERSDLFAAPDFFLSHCFSIASFKIANQASNYGHKSEEGSMGGQHCFAHSPAFLSCLFLNNRSMLLLISWRRGKAGLKEGWGRKADTTKDKICPVTFSDCTVNLSWAENEQRAGCCPKRGVLLVPHMPFLEHHSCSPASAGDSQGSKNQVTAGGVSLLAENKAFHVS